VFLGFVRGHTPIEIGEVMIVAGVAQLIAAPVAAFMETRTDARLLAGMGFGLFAAGLALNGFETPRSDYAFFLWPQVMRGAAIMLCLLPATRLSLSSLPQEKLADASALFNLMRNLGGAIAIALADTILEQRTEGHVNTIIAQLKAGSAVTARFVGLPAQYFHNRPEGPIDEFTRMLIEPLVKKAGITQSFNEAWLLLAILFALALFALPFIRRSDEKRTRLLP
jgi:MFS transporter, DHA2 family, multidrug resistance protein